MLARNHGVRAARNNGRARNNGVRPRFRIYEEADAKTGDAKTGTYPVIAGR
jgi:hypothetical protein